MRTLQALFNRIAGIAHDEADRLYRPPDLLPAGVRPGGTRAPSLLASGASGVDFGTPFSNLVTGCGADNNSTPISVIYDFL